MPQSPFQQNAVIITGASRGIGRQLALQLADQGARLSLASRDLSQLEEVASECRRRGGEVLAVETDVSDQIHCQHLIQSTVQTYGHIDTLVNNAGITMWALFEELQTLQPLEAIMQTNYMGSVYPTYYALPHLKASQGRIVVISSLTGKAGVPKRSGYAASKHALVGFFDSLRIELAPYGVSVTIAYPDFVSTETRARAFGPDGRPLGVSPVQEGQVMSAETCARLILKAAAGRQREAILSSRGKIGQWIKLIAPGLIDRIAYRAIQRGR